MSTCEAISQHVITGRLTARQAEVLEFIKERIGPECPTCHKGGRSPTVREIARHVGIRSPNGIAYHLGELQKKGFIKIDAGTARGIRLTGSGAAR